MSSSIGSTPQFQPSVIQNSRQQAESPSAQQVQQRVVQQQQQQSQEIVQQAATNAIENLDPNAGRGQLVNITV